ncbi:hypothetical protein Tco_0032969 [Tanacetum coccineum]
MSDSEDSMVTYTEAPPSPDYVPGLEELEQAPPSLDFVPELVYPEFMPQEDDVLPVEEQLLPAAVSPTADSPGYITKSDPEEDLKEDDEDPEADPADYPNNRDDDDEEEEPFGDNADNDEEDEDEDEEEKEEDHLALADSVLPPACRTTARMSIRDQTPIPFPSAAEVDRFLAISTLPPSPLTSYSSPLPHLHHYQASVAMMRAAAPSTYILVSQSETPLSGTPPLLPIPLPTSSPSLLLPSTDCRADVPKVTLPTGKRLCISPNPRFEVGECSSAPTRGFRADYDFFATLDAEIRRDPEREIGYSIIDVLVDPDEIAKEIPTTDVVELSKRMTDFITTVRQDTDEIYKGLDDAQDDRSLMRGYGIAYYSVSTTQVTARQSQQIPARDPADPDVPEEAGSSS